MIHQIVPLNKSIILWVPSRSENRYTHGFYEMLHSRSDTVDDGVFIKAEIKTMTTDQKQASKEKTIFCGKMSKSEDEVRDFLQCM